LEDLEMPGTAASPAKKNERAKSTPTSRVGKGEKVVCEVCGLSVVVEEVAGIVTREETTLLCCGKPMKARKATQKAKAPDPMKSRSLSGEPLSQAAGASGLVADPKEEVNQQ
jgi:hypothetical protein